MFYEIFLIRSCKKQDIESDKSKVVIEKKLRCLITKKKWGGGERKKKIGKIDNFITAWFHCVNILWNKIQFENTHQSMDSNHAHNT